MQEASIEQTCQIFGAQGIIVQLLLAALSFSVLVLKRFKQQPKRVWKIWALDTSKQAVSQSLAHFINVAISLCLSNKLMHDPCVWYFTTNILDNTIGVLICIGVLSFFQRKCLIRRLQKYKSGNYYTIERKFIDEQTVNSNSFSAKSQKFSLFSIKKMQTHYNINFRCWTIQLLIWNVIVLVSKTILFIFEFVFNSPLNYLSELLIGWIKPFPVCQLIVIIIIVPLIMNGLAFWVQDNFLQKSNNNKVIQIQLPVQTMVKRAFF